MSRSYWNEIDRRGDGNLKEPTRGRLESQPPCRYYPAVESVPLKPPPYYSNVARFSEQKSAAKKQTYSKTTANKGEEWSRSQKQHNEHTTPSFSPKNAAIFRSSAETASTSAYSSSSSFYESLKGEAASCCTVCGFQLHPATSASNSSRTGSEFLKAAALSSVGHGNDTVSLENDRKDLPPSVWLRSFVVQQQECLLKGCHSTESSIGFISSNTDESTSFLNSEGPSSICWVCLEAAKKAAKERQVEEDRLLAASLSKIIAEEQQMSQDDHSQMTKPPIPLLINECESQERNWKQSDPTQSKRNHSEHQDCSFHSDKNSGDVNDDSCIYIGEYNILGQRHGSHGELIWNSGDRYVGTFKNGKRSGQGAFFFRDGSEYTGDWEDDLMHGFGQCKFANGDMYFGQYHKGQKVGENCKYKFANSDLYVGGWENNHFHGFGRYFFADGSVLEGNFFYGVKHGKFKRQLPTEDLDILRFEGDKIVGQGVRWNAKRTKTWLLEVNDDVIKITSDAKKSKCHRTAIRVVRGIAGNLKFSRHKKTAEYAPSSVGVAEKTTTGEDDRNQFDATSFTLTSSLHHDNPIPVLAQKPTKNIVKKSLRISISQAVSIGYDCEIGTGRRVVPASVD